MPDRRPTLPNNIDDPGQRLECAVSHLTHRNVHDCVAVLKARVDASSAAARDLDIDWPEDHLARQRAEASER